MVKLKATIKIIVFFMCFKPPFADYFFKLGTLTSHLISLLFIAMRRRSFKLVYKKKLYKKKNSWGLIFWTKKK
jgi:hypothetical protein